MLNDKPLFITHKIFNLFLKHILQPPGWGVRPDLWNNMKKIIHKPEKMNVKLRKFYMYVGLSMQIIKNLCVKE